MYSKILVPLDGSKLAEQVLPYAQLLAGACDASLTLLQVTPAGARMPFTLSQSAGDYLKFTAASLKPSPADVVEKIGKPAEVIVDLARSAADGLIAMATHGMTGPRRWLLGSVASKVVQSAENPSLLIRATPNAAASAAVAFKRIIVPLDGSGVAETVLPHARALAGKLKLDVLLLRTYSLPPEAFVVADGVVDQGPAPFRKSLQEEAEKYLDGKVAGMHADGLTGVTASVIEGDPASEIIDLAASAPHNLIAMSTHGRSGVGRWALGSVAEKVIQHSRAPVLLIRAR
jgi:nucleotide-binding universal stress UspA family protein